MDLKTKYRMLPFLVLVLSLPVCAQPAGDAGLKTARENTISDWKAFMSSPEICAPNGAFERLNLHAPEPVTIGIVSFLEADKRFVRDPTYVVTEQMSKRRAVLSVSFVAAEICIPESSLKQMYGAGYYLPSIDHRYTPDELMNPTKYDRQIYFPKARENIAVNAIVKANQCVDRLTIEQSDCNH